MKDLREERLFAWCIAVKHLRRDRDRNTGHKAALHLFIVIVIIVVISIFALCWQRVYSRIVVGGSDCVHPPENMNT